MIENPFTLILASAGSGKTHRLTHHLLQLVHDSLGNGDPGGEVVERILAATFTRAAAGEIIDRVLEVLAEAVGNEGKRRNLSRELRGDETLSEDFCGAMLLAVVRRMHRMQICTLDSFLIRAAQAFAPELGIAQPWSILDDAADEAVALEAIDAVLDEHARDDAGRVRMLDLLIQVNRGRYPMQVRQKLHDHLRPAYDALLAGPAAAWETIGQGERESLDPDKLRECVCDLAKKLTPHVPQTKAGKPNARWITAIGKLCDDANGSDWEGVLSKGLISAMQKPPATFYGADLPDPLVKILNPLLNHCAAALLLRLRERNLSTRDLLLHFDAAYRAAKGRRSAWRFEDFTRLLVEAQVLAPDRLADFYFRVDGELDHVLLDEFQDTSIPQWKMLSPLAEEILSGGGGKSEAERTLLLVGDVKQTLYAWRNAEPRLLDELSAQWPQLQRQSLVTSYRSSQVIIDTVNSVFSSLAANAALQMHKEGDEPFEAAAAVWGKWFESHTTVHTAVPGFCRLSTCAAGEDAAELQENAIQLAAQRVLQMWKATPDKEIAVLVRRGKFIARVLHALQKLGVPCSGEGGNPLTDDAAVCAALSLLHLIDHPCDTAALYHVGISPLGAAVALQADADRKTVLRVTAELRMQVMDQGLGAVLNQWLGSFTPACDARNYRRFGQMIELAHGYSYDGGELRPFLEMVGVKRLEEASIAPVRVMTIHASKGRQFHYVVLPDLDDNFLGGGGAGILVDRQNVLDDADCITWGPDATLRDLDDRLKQMDVASKSRQIIEELCALYVAMTRARTGLEMIVHPPKPDKSDPMKLPRSAAGVLRGALTDGTATPDAELWVEEGSVFPEAVTGALDPPASVPEQAHSPLLEVKLIAPPAGTSRNRPMMTPSAMEGGGFTSLAGVLSLDRSASLDRGTALHRMFEQIEWLDNGPPDEDALRAATSDLGLTAAVFTELLAEFTAACGKPALRGLLGSTACRARLKAATSLDVWRERSFIVPMTEGDVASLVHGQMDRVVVAMRDGRAVAAEIIDYKTDRVAGKAALAERVETYRPQLQAYRKAVSALLKLEHDRVAALLMFTASDMAVPIAPR